MVESNESSSGSQKPPEQPELCGGTMGFVMMIVMLIALFIMINPELRKAIAYALDPAFNPVFGFGGKYPGLTLLCTSLFLVFCSTTIRHFMTDWVEIARAQKMMTAFQKERTDAMLSGNTLKQKKLEEMNPEISKKQMVLMTANLKPVVFTMLFFIVVFPWIWMVYIEEHMQFPFMSLPGVVKWDLTGVMDWCIIPWGNWILIYIVLSFPIGFLIQNALKYITFTQKIKQTEIKKESELDTKIQELEEQLTTAEKSGISVGKSRELMAQVKEKLTEKEYSQVSAKIDDAQSHLERKTQTHERVVILLSQAENMIESAKKKGVSVDSATKSLSNANKALKRNDDTSAIYYGKQTQRQIKEARIAHKDAEETLSSVKALMYDLRDLNTKEADQIFDEAKSAMDNKDYDRVLKRTKATKVKAEEIKNLHSEATAAVKTAKNSLDTIKHLELSVPNADEIYYKADRALTDHKYSEALDHATQCIELITAEKEKFSEAQESVSFAKLVVANAITFGADVVRAEHLVADAETALARKNYNLAIELANTAKDIAEQAKRQQQRISKRK